LFLSSILRGPAEADNFHFNPSLFKDIEAPKEIWYWLQPEEEDQKDEEKDDECTGSDLSVSFATK